MSLIAIALRHMMAGGMAEEAMLAAVAEMEAAIKPPRSKGAERQARYVERQKASQMTGSDARDDNDAAEQKENTQTQKEKPTPLNGSPKGEPIPPSAEQITAPVLKEEHVLEAFNDMADRAGLPKAKMTPERRKKLRPFVRRHTVDDITEAIAAIERSPFCRGENDRGWKANFDFLLQPSTFTKLTEGTYG